MRYTLSFHAEQQLLKRKIPLSLLEQVLEKPQQIIPEYEGRMAYQSKVYGGRMLLRAIVKEDDPLVVVTIYLTSKVNKYWSIS